MLTAALLIGIGTALLATRRCGGESAIRCCCVGSLGTRRSKASVVANTIRTRAGRINGVNPADAVEALKLQRVWGVHRFRLAFAEQQQQHARHTTRPAVLGQFSVRRRQRVRTIVPVSLWSTTAARIEMWRRHSMLQVQGLHSASTATQACRVRGKWAPVLGNNAVLHDQRKVRKLSCLPGNWHRQQQLCVYEDATPTAAAFVRQQQQHREQQQPRRQQRHWQKQTQQQQQQQQGARCLDVLHQSHHGFA